MTTRTADQSADSAASVRTIALMLFLLGASCVYVIGFAGSATLHSAAHDARHSLAFPCH